MLDLAKRKIVVKFGGSSLRGADEMLQCASILRDYERRGSSIVCVCSAIGDTTDLLLEAFALASLKDFKSARAILKVIRKRHVDVIKEIIIGSELEIQGFIERKIDGVIQELAPLKNFDIRTQDSIISIGEQLSTLIFSKLLALQGLKTLYLNGGDAGITTDETFGFAKPLLELTEAKLQRNLLPLMSEGITPVVTGYIAKTTKGEITTLGRGGSDYSATLIASAISADELYLFTDVDGILSADPQIVRNARTVKQLSYLEASEASFFGAKSMPSQSLNPVARKRIPVWIKNTFNPLAKGTLITHEESKKEVKCVGSISTGYGLATVGLVGNNIGNQIRIEAIEALALDEIDVLEDDYSGSKLTFVIKEKDRQKALKTLHSRFFSSSEISELIAN